jgi:large exoprotein involved in heme utilization and adhesion
VTIEGLASPAQSVLIDGFGSGIFTDTQGTGAGGNIFVNANSVTLQNGGTLSATTSGTGNGGEIQINAGTINLLGFASINTLSFLGDGSAGNIALKATQQITTTDSFLNSDAVEGTGGGGTILLSSPSIIVNGGVLSTSTTGTGDAGNILLEGQQINLGASPSAPAQGADLFASTSGSGHGGTISLGGLDGLSSYAENVTIAGTSRLQTLTGADGSAGDITIQATQFALTDRSTLNANTFGSGIAGTITISATDSAIISGVGSSVSSSSDFGATGNAGQITVSAPNVLIENGGLISTTTAGEAIGGNVNISATESVTMNSGATISASSTGPGKAGEITINAGGQLAMTNSNVTTEANLSGGGAIKITTAPSGTVQLTNSTISASVLDGTGGGGSVNIDPQFVILQNSQITANAVSGPGGNIFITTNLLLPDSTSVISASSQFGQQGTITIQSPVSPASGKINPIGQKPLIPTSMVSQRCAALAGGNISSFTVAGRDSLPAEPGDWLSSPLASSISNTDGSVREAERLMSDSVPLLSLRNIAPLGFLTQSFAMDWSGGCTS